MCTKKGGKQEGKREIKKGGRKEEANLKNSVDRYLLSQRIYSEKLVNLDICKSQFRIQGGAKVGLQL